MNVDIGEVEFYQDYECWLLVSEVLGLSISLSQSCLIV
jgi:hypothetical protein